MLHDARASGGQDGVSDGMLDVVGRGAERERPGALNASSYWLTRFLILRLLGLVYLVAFLSLAHQVLPLIGTNGLLPAADFLERVAMRTGSRGAGFAALPSVFWFDTADAGLVALAWLGVGGAAIVLAGYANAILLAVLWALYMSFVHIGQVWYGYGWEIQLLETGFLAIFLVPLLDGRPFPRTAPPTAVLWLYRWLIARIMLGAGLIKLRGDSCWRDLTCLQFHYETQPIPNPLSRVLHFMPRWFHQLGVVWNHVTELVLPWFAFGPSLMRRGAGVLLVAFQMVLIASGNLSFLNWLTIVPCLACLDDAFLQRLLPGALVRRADGAARDAVAPSAAGRVVVGVLLVIVAALSVAPVQNLLSPRQAMNTSFDRLHLVNTYGAFGSIGRQRPELVFEGTTDTTITDTTEWRSYEFKCKPGEVDRRPCQISPYHYRLDWQIWFAAMSEVRRHPWTIHLVAKLLEGDPAILTLFAENPFPDQPPRYVRILRYRYELVPRGDASGAWWRRELIGQWFPPIEVDGIRMQRMLREYGWSIQAPAR